MANNVYVSDESLERATAGWLALHSIYGGCNMLVGLDMDGKLCFTTDTHAYLLFWKWDDMKMISLDKHHNAVVFGLKQSGTCMIGKSPFAVLLRMAKNSLSRDCRLETMALVCFWMKFISRILGDHFPVRNGMIIDDG